MAAGAEDGPTIESCPECFYSLRGLPRVHACPECGQEYDERSRVWQCTRLRAIILRSISDLFPLVGFFVIAALAGFAWWVSSVFALVVVGTAVHVGYLWLRFGQTGPMVACLPDGIHVRYAARGGLGHTDRPDEFIPWSAIDEVMRNPRGPEAIVLVDGGYAWHLAGPFANHEEAQDFVECARLHFGIDGMSNGAGADDDEEQVV